MKTDLSVVLLATHLMNDFVIAQYHAIKKGIDDDTDLFLLLEDNDIDLSLLPADVKYYPFSVDSLNMLGYTPIEETIIPGSNHFPVLQFYKDNPGYKYYWNIEYDVYFNGDWYSFFKAFTDIHADFVSSHIETYGRRPQWYWWYTLSLKTITVNRSDLLKSFNPIYRISGVALRFLDDFLRKDNAGHHEALIPTLLNVAGFSLLDLGGSGILTPDFLKNKFYASSLELDAFYTQSTMRYRPGFIRADIEKQSADSKLYHPVKE